MVGEYQNYQSNRNDQEKLKILVMGDFKCGKTTLINALLEEEILPASVVPCTAIITEMKYGEQKRAVLHFKNPLPNILPKNLKSKILRHMEERQGRPIPPMEIPCEEIEDYLMLAMDMESDGLSNGIPPKSIYDRLELFHPAEFLKSGVEIIDTPDLAEVGMWMGAVGTIECLQKADVTLFILNAASPCTSDEMHFVEDMLLYNGFDPVFFVVNKCDLIRPEDQPGLRRYVESKLKILYQERQIEKQPELFCLSAQQALDGCLKRNVKLLEKSGIMALKNCLAKSSAKERGKNELEQEKDFFSLENLEELCEIDEHLAFADGLAEKYGRSMQEGSHAKEWAVVFRQLDRIREKKRDKVLNVSVIGEFTTGKSTFINALIGKELLVSSALQGTTVASTIIEYGSEYRIYLKYLSGHSDQNFVYANARELKNGLKRFTTDPKVARTLKAVYVRLPAEILKGSFRIIDTPGTNVTEAWHEEVTVRTLKEISDLSIILISADKPASRTLLDFAARNLGTILPQCIFVVTKLDTIRRRERDSLLTYIKKKVEEELEIRDAVVLPYVSPMVLNVKNVSDGEDSEDIESDFGEIAVEEDLLQSSLETEQILMQHTARQKTLAMTKRLTALIEDMYQSIAREMTKISEDYENRLELLERSRKADLKQFVNQEKQYRLESFEELAESCREDIEDELAQKSESAVSAILIKVEECGNLDGLNEYFQGALADSCSEKAKSMISDADDYYQIMQDCFQTEMDHFGQAFVEMYRTFKIIPVDLSKSKYKLPEKVEVDIANITLAAEYVAEKLRAENWAFGGGAAAGAAIGTAVLPVVGTVVGGLIGAFVGAGIAPSTDEVKKECRNKLSPQLVTYYKRVSDEILSAVEQYEDRMRSCLSDEIDRYLSRYRKEVEHQISLENGQRASINQKLNDLKADMDRMLNHKKQLESVMEQLNRFGRKER